MLSIGNGKAWYYANLAEKDDYYQQGAEPPGLWHGNGAEEFGLTGEVAKQDFYALCAGYDPRSAEKLVHHAGTERRRALWDFTFSSPKGVSVWWAMTDEGTREQLSRCQLRAVQRTLDYAEGKGIIGTRKGGSGKELDPCHKLIWALYEHSTSREQDAELHTHAVLINAGINQDGKTRTLDPAEAVRQKMLLGAVYRAELSREIQREFGVEVEQLPKGMFDVQGVPEDLKADHSTRRRQILEAMEQEGAKGARAASVFVLTTRKVKEHRPRTELFKEWAERGKEYGLNEQEIIGRREFTEPTREQTSESLSKALASITKEQAYFTEVSLLKGLAIEAQYTGAGFAQCRQVAGEYLEKQAVYLGTEKGQKLYTTPEIDRLEKRMLSQAIEGRDKEFPALRRPRQVDLSGLSDEQRRAIDHLTDTRGSIKIVSGMAGAGKTTMLRSAREVWEAQGFQVQGVALAAVAAKGLEEEAKIPSRPIAKLLYSIDNPQKDEGPWLNHRTVLVVDEAGMVGTLQMARLVEEAEKAGARLALVGDAEQLQPIEHGAPFKVFGHLLGKVELQEIRRQREEWQREAAHDFAGGRALEGLTKYQERGLLTITEKRADAVRQLVDAWSKDSSDYRDKIMMASTRAEVNELNRLGQQSRIDRGELGTESVKVNGQDFHAGDRMLFRKNDKRLGVLNGEKATVKEIDTKSETLIARLDGGELRMIPLRRYEQVQLGYAFTTHAEQGDTREKTFVLIGGSMQDRELSYVQMTRHRAEAHIFTSVEDAGKTLETLAEVMNRSRQKELAQEKRQRGIEIAPALNRESREETVRVERKPAAEQHQQQAAEAKPWFGSILEEDRRKVSEVVRALEQIAGVSDEMRRNPHAQSEEKAKEINAWVRYGQPIAEKIGIIPSFPLDAEIKGRLIETLQSLHWMTRGYEHGQGHREYVSQSMNAAREALRKVKPDLLTWELGRSVSGSNGNFQIIEKLIEQGGRVEKLWQHGGPGENNLSVFTVHNLPGTYTAHRHGMDKTSLNFDERVNRFGHAADPSDSSRVKEIEYDPIKIRTEQAQQERTQARQIERGQEQNIDRGGYGYSR